MTCRSAIDQACGCQPRLVAGIEGTALCPRHAALAEAAQVARAHAHRWRQPGAHMPLNQADAADALAAAIEALK